MSPAPEIVRMWLPRNERDIFVLGHKVCRCDASTNNLTVVVALCDSPLVAQVIVEALEEKIRRDR